MFYIPTAMKKIVTAIFILAAISLTASAQQGYRLQLCVRGCEGKKVYLGAYYGYQYYLADSVILDASGNGLMTKEKKPLLPGMYTLVLNQRKSVDFLLSKEQQVSISTDTANPYMELHTAGSAELTQYEVYIKEVLALQQQIVTQEIMLRAASADSVIYFRDKIKALITQIRSAGEQRLRVEPNSLLGHYIRLTTEPEPPVRPLSPSEDLVKDYTKQYRAYTQHYFDNVDLTYEPITRIPAFGNRVGFYFNRLIVQNPDTINRCIDSLLKRCEKDKEVYRFVLKYVFQNYYDKAALKPYEACFVHICDAYYFTGKAWWTQEKFTKMLKQRVDLIRPTMYGHKAPDLVLKTPDDRKITLYDVQADYTIVFFYEYDCGYCREVVPQLQKVADEYSSKVKVLAVYTHADKEKWKEYISQNKLKWINAHDPTKENKIQTLYNVQKLPCIFLLDKDKNVIEKKIQIELLEQMLKKSIR